MNTLGDASRLIVEKQLEVEESALTQYIRSAIHLLELQGKSIEDYALIKVNNPMTLKDDNTVTINSQWRLIHVDKLENVPEWEDA